MAANDIGRIRGEQIKPGVLRDWHFDSNFKINEDKINIDWNAHLSGHEDRITKLETEDDRFAYVASGGETQVDLPDGKKAKPNSLFVTLNGLIQAPGVNYDEVKDVDGNVTGIIFPNPLVADDVVLLWWKNV